jgi:hypothetical protein
MVKSLHPDPVYCWDQRVDDQRNYGVLFERSHCSYNDICHMKCMLVCYFGLMFKIFKMFKMPCIYGMFYCCSTRAVHIYMFLMHDDDER